MNSQLTDFGNRLKVARESRAMSVCEIARVTKIPERSLLLMEDGRFDNLPGDVFVRGFLRSYSRCVGLDPEDMVRRYGELTAHEIVHRQPVLAPQIGVPHRGRPGPAATPRRPEPAKDGEKTAEAPPQQPDASVLARSILETGLGPRRMSLTLAVIILVIVATLTLSLLLRRPSSHVGDGVSALPSVSSHA